MNAPNLRRGILVEVQRRTAQVIDDVSSEELRCAYSPEIDLKEFSNFAVGDRVEFYPGDSAQEPLITGILPRTGKISRPGPGERFARELILAANVDLLVIVASTQRPDFNPRQLDRYIAVAENFKIQAIICVNKSDLQPEIPEAARYLGSLGYELVMCSALTGAGIASLQDKLRGRLSVFSGPSGAGKSSLIQMLIPEAGTIAGEVRRDGKGRHTTTTSRLYSTPDGMRIIDTPGLRELGLWNVKPDEVAGLWRDFRPYLGTCRFNDCRHQSEPGCALLAAVETGKIPEFRLQSYYRILETLGEESL
ncbi:MAG TPA: ribosome small subunit-dependent GTPase A [Fibrobacteres bacterium]|jgi:ribosome biogenesis GTPase|nr:ribosome small subunit-dependent GTPase A [Fibrobacterota bacterium]